MVTCQQKKSERLEFASTCTRSFAGLCAIACFDDGVARRAKERNMRCLVRVILCMSFLAQRSAVVGFVSQASVAARRVCPNRSIDRLKLPHFAEQDEQSENDIQEASGFDGEGFTGYLAPYALALLASVAVTAAFFKFVLLDY